jgi:hypothetical protein
MSSAAKNKGSRVEREIRDAHLKVGIPAKKMPLSGALGGEYAGDLLIANKLRAEVKARKSGKGFAMIQKWLGPNDLLFLRENHDTPKVVMTFEVYITLLHTWCEKNGVEYAPTAPVL